MDKTLGLCRSTEDCGKGISMLALRLFAAYEFGEAGLAKWRGENWFADIRDAFPFPFDLLPAGLSWNLAMGAELVVPGFTGVGPADAPGCAGIDDTDRRGLVCGARGQRLQCLRQRL